MSERSSAPIGILAGHGSLPVEIARAITLRGGRVQVVAIDPAVSLELYDFPHTRLGLGQVGAILKAFRDVGCQELVIVGGTSRPDLGTLRPDFGLFANLPHVIGLVFSGGDDGMLRLVVRFFETKGFTVVSPATVAPHLIVAGGAMTRDAPTAGNMADILLGSNVVKSLGAFDIGQAVIVADGVLIAVEAAEGTDRMLGRVAASRVADQRAGHAAATRGVLIKRTKPGQELRVDLPTIGPDTVVRAAQAGLAGIAVLAGHALAADRATLATRAAERGLFVYGFTDGCEAMRTRGPDGWQNAFHSACSKRRANATQLRDMRRGASALSALAALTCRASAVVSRGHILGIETLGSAAALFARATRHKQWGEGRWRSGVGVLATECVLTPDVIKAACDAKLAGVAVMGTRASVPNLDLVAQADAAGLFLVQLTPTVLG